MFFVDPDRLFTYIREVLKGFKEVMILSLAPGQPPLTHAEIEELVGIIVETIVEAVEVGVLSDFSQDDRFESWEFINSHFRSYYLPKQLSPAGYAALHSLLDTPGDNWGLIKDSLDCPTLSLTFNDQKTVIRALAYMQAWRSLKRKHQQPSSGSQ